MPLLLGGNFVMHLSIHHCHQNFVKQIKQFTYRFQEFPQFFQSKSLNLSCDLAGIEMMAESGCYVDAFVMIMLPMMMPEHGEMSKVAGLLTIHFSCSWVGVVPPRSEVSRHPSQAKRGGALAKSQDL